jgi:trans-aconitate 2-methyltransferase
MIMPWDPEQYHRFQAQRALPFDDLVALVQKRDGLTAVDLGCGTGELTRQLADLLLKSDVVGIDSSAEMLARAAEYARPGLRFEQARVEDIMGSWDLIFSNAALHWVDDQIALIPRLFGMVRPGGQLAVQVPSNHNHPSHALIREIAGEDPFRTALDGFARESPVLGIGEYAELLFASGGRDIVAFEKVYPHILPDSDAVVEWTTLVPYLERLSPDLAEQFLAVYRERLHAIMPGSPVFYGFRRTLFAATKGDIAAG